MARTPAGTPHDPRGAERFNEERATYSVRGSAQPDIEAGVTAIRNVVKTLPARPGVYRMLDTRGDVLYVGKARVLKNRVANYTQVERLPNRLQRMVSQTRAMEIITTNSEAEALLLEAQLIKKFRPAYNVLLRDDKSFPFILLRADHAYPRIMKHRGARRAKGNYYGPFASAGWSAPRLMHCRSCSCKVLLNSFLHGATGPACLSDRRCAAPCVGRIDEQGYAELVRRADFLGRRSSAVQAKIEESSRCMQRPKRSTLKPPPCCATGCARRPSFQGSQAIQLPRVGMPISSLASKGGQVGIQAFFVRGGQGEGLPGLLPQPYAGRKMAKCWPACWRNSMKKCRRPNCCWWTGNCPNKTCWQRPWAHRPGIRLRSASPSAATGGG
ncbi:MAG: GIY-YIG nuclease family protein [Sphingomonadaceae bacterium]